MIFGYTLILTPFSLMKRVALFGESPNDTSCIATLLRKRYVDSVVQIENLIPNLTEAQIKNEFHGGKLYTRVKHEKSKLRRLINTNYRLKKPDLVVFVVDLDSNIDNREQVLLRKLFFRTYKTQVQHRALLLLNVHELEALLLADMEAINLIFGINEPQLLNVMEQEDPKGYLEMITQNKYYDSQNPELFKRLNFNAVFENCQYFKSFIHDFERVLQHIA